MFRSKKFLSLLTVLMVMSMVLGACATPTPAATPAPAAQPTTPPKAAPTQPPAPTAPPAPPTAVPTEAGPQVIKSKDPTTMVEMSFGDPETLDPAHDYETAGSQKLLNIYEGLVTYAGADPVKMTAQLAEAIPDPVKTADGGVQYVWKIKDGVKFHNGDPLTAEDVAFSFWRTILENDNAVDPGFLVSEAFFLNPDTKNPMDDATELVDPSGKLVADPDSLKKVDAKKLVAACEKVQNAITFDNDTRTVTMTLDHPWGPFLISIASNWAFATDKKWVAAQGEWDGDCKTWQNFYGIPTESQILRDKTNGTGPYMLEKWTPGEELSLVAFPDYWGPKPKIQRWVEKIVNEFGTRFAAVQAGDSDNIQVGSQADWAQLDTIVRDECDINTGQCVPAEPANPNGILRRYKNRPSVLRTDIQFNWKVAADSTFIGSAKLDGNGIPPDFFSDVHVRKAFEYCFDFDTYIKDVQYGEGAPSLALTLPGQPGYEGSTNYTYDPQKCKDELAQSTWKTADGKSLSEIGFYMQLAYNAGNTQRQSIAEIMAAGLAQAGANYFISPVAMPWPTFLRARRATQFAISSVGWQEDIHDPHNWYVPYLTGTYAIQMNLPDDLKKGYQALMTQGVFEIDQAKRAAIYSQLNQKVYEDAIYIILPVALNRRYEPLWLHGWWEGKTRNPMVGGQGSFIPDFSKD